MHIETNMHKNWQKMHISDLQAELFRAHEDARKDDALRRKRNRIMCLHLDKCLGNVNDEEVSNG